MSIRVAAVQAATPTGREDARALAEVIGGAVVAGAELIALALRPPPRLLTVADPTPRALRGLAAGHNVWLVAGPYVEHDADGRAYLAAGLWDPEGTWIGSARQTHQPPGSGWTAADTLAPLPLTDRSGARWPLGLILGEDIRYPEVGRILALQGAEVLIHLGVMPAPYNPWEQERRLWREVQANQTFGLESYPLVPGGGGYARVLAPCEMTPGGAGILAATNSLRDPAAAIADLDAAAREAVLAAYPIANQLNREMYHRLPGAYD
jgi:omega-amidase